MFLIDQAFWIKKFPNLKLLWKSHIFYVLSHFFIEVDVIQVNAFPKAFYLLLLLLLLLVFFKLIMRIQKWIRCLSNKMMYQWLVEILKFFHLAIVLILLNDKILNIYFYNFKRIVASMLWCTMESYIYYWVGFS
jgi:hypothetical protein